MFPDQNTLRHSTTVLLLLEKVLPKRSNFSLLNFLGLSLATYELALQLAKVIHRRYQESNNGEFIMIAHEYITRNSQLGIIC